MKRMTALIAGLSVSASLWAAPVLLVNQAGYITDWPKRALLTNPDVGTTRVEVLQADNLQPLMTLPITRARIDPHSADVVAEIDLQALPEGRYQLRVGDVYSPAFRVADDVYSEATSKLLHSYYLQRCGPELKDEVTGLQHPAEHQQDALLRHDDDMFKAGTAWPATGGWHDAGDYGKYVTTTAVTLGHLLDMYELKPEMYPDNQTQIPESGNGQSDLLDEVQVGLTWLLAMQRSDGAVYRKVAGNKWPSGAPEEDTQPRFVYGVSSPETAKVAAVMAQAARVYQTINPQQAERYRQSALLAWQWLASIHDNQRVDWYPEDDLGSGKYLESDVDLELSLLTDMDDRIWAASELWLLTHDRQYLKFLLNQNYLMTHLAIFEWKNPSLLGVLHLLTHTNADLPPAFQQRLTLAVLELADDSVRRSAMSAFGLANHRFIWGSNKMAAEEGFLLAYAYRLSGRPQYWQAAVTQLDFILGLNPQGLSFVSGVGERSVQHVMHVFGKTRKTNIVGLLVGGANDLAQDNIAPKGQGILSYLDDDRAYSVNEYAIDYNAALLGLLGVLMDTADSYRQTGRIN